METTDCSNHECNGNIDGKCVALDGKTGCAAWYLLTPKKG